MLNAIDMKRLIFFVFAALITNAAFAQTDIKVFDRIGPDAVLNKLDALGFYNIDIDSYVTWTENDGDWFLEYSDGKYTDPTVVLSEGAYRLIGFETSSSEFLFLTDYVSGGFRVGDSISKLLNVDFSQSEYGRGNPLNNCRLTGKTSSGKDTYIIFGEELYHISLTVTNGRIESIVYIRTQEDPYDNYDYSIEMF